MSFQRLDFGPKVYVLDYGSTATGFPANPSFTK
jgi:hypothetical protein